MEGEIGRGYACRHDTGGYTGHRVPMGILPPPEDKSMIIQRECAPCRKNGVRGGKGEESERPSPYTKKAQLLLPTFFVLTRKIRRNE